MGIGTPRKGFNVLVYNKQKRDRQKKSAEEFEFCCHKGHKFKCADVGGVRCPMCGSRYFNFVR